MTGGATRRDLLKAGLALPALSAAGLGTVAGLTGCQAAGSGIPGDGPHVVVVGAGAFGGWTALELRRRGARVTLVDAWGPGNARASSGGDTRVLRHSYGDSRLYLDMTARALELWQEHQQRWGRTLFERTGVLWMVQDDDAYEQAALATLAEAGLAHERFDVDELARRWPQVDPSGVRWAFVEHDAGVLYARRSCAAVLEAFMAEGGEYRQALVAPGEMRGGRLQGVLLDGGPALTADAYVFACGPWLGRLFPGLSDEPLVRSTRQEVFTFGVPAGNRAHQPPALPVWADHGDHFWYGIPGNEGRGFKLADDTRGPDFDPTDGDRTPSAEGLAAARRYVESRFPALADAPLLEARVCQYENSPDGDFIVDTHPEAADTWLVGGGSGHGFKHGPALGELVAGCVLGERETEPSFRLDRLTGR